MDRLARFCVSAAISGTAASIAAALALALAAKSERRGALQPINATSHWLHGTAAARHSEADISHTLVGYGTHHASSLFWALPFQAWVESRPTGSLTRLMCKAAAVSAIAAAVDYGITPKRLTPGWELVLSKRSIGAVYGAMAIGLALGAILARNVSNEG